MDEAVLYDGSLTASPNVLAQELPDGEIIFLHLATEEYYGLDLVGTRMYHRLIESESVRAAHDRLITEFDVSAERLRGDIVALADQLMQRGIVEFCAA